MKNLDKLKQLGELVVQFDPKQKFFLTILETKEGYNLQTNKKNIFETDLDFGDFEEKLKLLLKFKSSIDDCKIKQRKERFFVRFGGVDFDCNFGSREDAIAFIFNLFSKLNEENSKNNF